MNLFMLILVLGLDQIDRTGSVSHEDGDNENYQYEDDNKSFALNIGRNLNDNLNDIRGLQVLRGFHQLLNYL